MAVTVAAGFFICSLGLQKGVEKNFKNHDGSLFVILSILVVRSVTLPGAGKGIAFYPET
jgi:NSS family neurotransmitter:Na+ symporter